MKPSFRLIISCVAGLTGFGTLRAEPITPAVSAWATASQASLVAKLQQVIADDRGDGGELATLVGEDLSSWRIYARDRRLLVAIPTSRNLSAREKITGEKRAADLARAVLQQDSGIPIKKELDADTVQVVLVEPDAHQPYVRGGGPIANGGGGWGGGLAGNCGGMGGGAGGVAGPLPTWPAGAFAGAGGSSGGACNCR